MEINKQACFSRLLLAVLAAVFFSACGLPSPKMPKMPGWLGGRDSTEAADAEVEKNATPAVPGNRMAGVVHLVNDRGHFVLVKSIAGRRARVPVGTIWMSYDANGKPSAKLKVSEERKGVFVVADIVQGAPSRGDSVVLHGLMDKQGKIKTVTSPGSEERQILE